MDKLNQFRDPIGKMVNWHNGAVKSDEVAKQKQHQAEQKRLYSDTLEKFEAGFERLSKLDGSTDPCLRDTDDKPGSVNVFGVGSLRKTSDGFVMELCKTLPLAGVVGLGLGLGAIASTREVFTVNTEERTIRHDVHHESSSVPTPGYGLFPSVVQWGTVGGYLSSQDSSRTVDLDSKEVSVHKRPLFGDDAWQIAK